MLLLLTPRDTLTQKELLAAQQRNIREIERAITEFRSDQHRNPASIEELVDYGYLKTVPRNPLVQKGSGWTVVRDKNGLVTGVTPN